MDKIMEKSFDALEAALTQLTESISSYNPSPIAASAVVLADNGISKSLELRMVTYKLSHLQKHAQLTLGNRDRCSC